MTQIILLEENLVESRQDSEGKVYLEGIYAASERKNQNLRVYPHKVLSREMNKYIKESVDKNIAYSELSHPSHMHINPDNISHRILSLKEDGNFWRGRAIVLDTPKGNIVKALVKDGGVIGMSTRGLGTLKESNNCKVVQEDFALKAIDAVISPSCIEATMTAIMESTETFYCESEGCYILAEEIKNDINKTSKANIEKKMLESFQKYVNYLNL